MRASAALVALLLATPAAAQSWSVTDEASPVTGKHTVTISTYSGDLPDAYGRGTTQFMLGIRCAPDFLNKKRYRLEAFVALGSHMAAQYTCMNLKIDDGPPVEECGTQADNYRGYFWRQPAKFAKSLVGKKRLIMEVPTYRSGRIVAEFRVVGLGEKLSALSPYCSRL